MPNPEKFPALCYVVMGLGAKIGAAGSHWFPC